MSNAFTSWKTQPGSIFSDDIRFAPLKNGKTVAQTRTEAVQRAAKDGKNLGTIKGLGKKARATKP